MAYQRWSWVEGGAAGLEPELPVPITALPRKGGYPALFNLCGGVGFFAVGPGQGLLYYFDRRRDTAFLFPNPLG